MLGLGSYLQTVFRCRHNLTSCVRLAVVLSAVLHFHRRQTERFDHFMCALAPIWGAEGQHRER